MFFVSSLFFFFVEQKTAYELLISDWSSDVCSSDLSVIVDLYIVIFSGSAFMFDSSDSIDSTVLPPAIHFKSFTDARAAVERLVEIYARNTAFIREQFAKYAKGDSSVKLRVRAYYPAIRFKVNTSQAVQKNGR